MNATNKERIEIRRLQSVAEAELCARLMVESEPWITLGRTYEAALKIMRDPLREVYLACIKSEIVGFAILLMQGALVGYIQTIYVAPEWRNRRVGSSLIAFAEQRILGETPNVFLTVSSFNKDAQRLYRRLGYQVVGTLTNYIVAGHSEILMRKTLGPLAEFKRKA